MNAARNLSISCLDWTEMLSHIGPQPACSPIMIDITGHHVLSLDLFRQTEADHAKYYSIKLDTDTAELSLRRRSLCLQNTSHHAVGKEKKVFSKNHSAKQEAAWLGPPPTCE